MVMRRSSCCFGRMEIKSSSDESQLIVFSARSLLPLKLMKPIRRPSRAADHHEAALRILFAGVVGAGGGQGQRPFLVLGIVHVDRRRTQVARRQALAGGVEQLLHAGLVGVLDLPGNERAGIPVAVPFISLTMGCDLISCDQRDLRIRARQSVRSDSGRESDLCPASRPSFAIRSVSASLSAISSRPSLSGGSSMSKRPPAIFDVFLDGIHFGLLVVARRAGDDQGRAIGWALRPFAAGRPSWLRSCPWTSSSLKLREAVRARCCRSGVRHFR